MRKIKDIDLSIGDDSLEGLASEADKSGTNPINFTYDARIYNEYQWLNVPGGGTQNVTTFEFRAPFADGKWQFRTRLRKVHLDIPGVVSESGFGDMDVRFMTVPYVSLPDKFAIATGFDVFIPTGSHDALSSNALSLGPQIFLAFFGAFGGLVDLFAPGYQHQFSIWNESGASRIHQSNFDFYFVKTFNKGQQWILFDPQVIIDWENGKEFMVVDTEFGTMLDEHLGTEGHSAWLRPAFGVGADRPLDYSLEAGYKIVW